MNSLYHAELYKVLTQLTKKKSQYRKKARYSNSNQTLALMTIVSQITDSYGKGCELVFGLE